MLKIDRILFPTDFSCCAEQAFSHAARLAARCDAELHVLHVTEPHHTGVPLLEGMQLDEHDVAEQLRIAVAEAHEADADGEERRGARVLNVQIEDESAIEAILDYAETQGIDLIVLGTHGRQGLNRLLLGSVADALVRLAPCPVLTVRQQTERAKRPPNRLLVPIDFSDSSRLSLDVAKELAVLYGASLDLLHVVQEMELPHVYGIEPVVVAEPMLNERIRQALVALADEHIDGVVSTRVHVAGGIPARDIVEFAEERGTDMIVIATHGLTGLKRLFLGSVTERVVRMAPCPVLTVKSFGKTCLDPSLLSHETTSA
jgi:nucleotide-binding universal stress UspA family protein